VHSAGRHVVPSRWIIRLIASVVFGCLLFASSTIVHPPAPPVPPPPVSQLDWEATFPTRIEAVTSALGHLPWPVPTPQEEPQGAGALRWTHRRYELTLPGRRTAPIIEEAFAPVRSAAPGVSLRVIEGSADAQVQVGIDGLLTHTIMLHWLGRHARVAIVIEELGNDLLIARQLVDTDVQLTFAVIPFRPFSKEVAQLASLFGREVLLQLPAQAGSGGRATTRGTPQVAAGRNETVRAVEEDLAAVPHVAGVTAALSTFGDDVRDSLQSVLAPLRAKDLFVIDSSTPLQDAACGAAAAVGVQCIAVGVRLDETDDEEAIAAQINSLLQAAQGRGDVIAVVQPGPATLTVLHVALPVFAAAEIDVVPASVIARDQSLSGR
jgi:polysaccharide deacetylase 2 family uncharacterized protein YibQ